MMWSSANVGADAGPVPAALLLAEALPLLAGCDPHVVFGSYGLPPAVTSSSSGVRVPSLPGCAEAALKFQLVTGTTLMMGPLLLRPWFGAHLTEFETS